MRKVAFVEQLKASYPVTRLCHARGVSPSGSFAWRRRGPSRRTLANTTLQQRIVAIHPASRATDGAPRMHAEVRGEGGWCSRKRVARLMRGAGLAGVAGCHRRRFRTTQRDPARPSAPDLLQRTSIAAAPNQVWVADLTSVPTRQGFLFLAISSSPSSWTPARAASWADSMAAHLRAELVLAALDMALQHRRPAAGVIRRDPA
jgi:putative transposase